jgi:hypothetical protein
MEDYYSNKWNQEFGKVKHNLEKTLQQRKEVLERAH